MTRDDIIRMAREAGWTDLREFDSEMSEDFFVGRTQDLERFATLVASERDIGWHKIVHDECEAAIKEEREACAQIVEAEAMQYAEPVWAVEIINDIRARN